MPIRNIYQNEIPIIALSAHANKIEMDKCLNFGMNALVSKPIDEELLLLEMFKLSSQCIKEMQQNENMTMTKRDYEDFKNATTCHICACGYKQNDEKVRVPVKNKHICSK